MPKRSSALWTAAILISAAPTVYFWIATALSGGADERSFGWVSYGWCTGREIDLKLQDLLSPLWDSPLLWFGSAPLIALAWGGRLLSERIERPRLGRILTRSVVAVLIVLHLPTPLLFVLDASGNSMCVDGWGPPEVASWVITMGLYNLLPVVLVLLVVRRPGPPRRNRLARTGAAVSIAFMMIVLAVADTAPGKVSTTHELDCAGFGDRTDPGLSEPEKGFLCGIRDDRPDRGVPELANMPDRELLAYGHHLCDLAVRNGGDVSAPAVAKAMSRTPGFSLVRALTKLCPKVAEVLAEEERQRQAESAAYIAAAERACSAHPRHRPRIKPVRQARATMWTEFWHIDAWDEGNEEAQADNMVADLVGSAPGALNVWAAEEVGHACVTGEAYRRRPPVETRGWEQVVEVG
ncbi:hypothetical protein [Streptosporangium sp. NPDC051022]|uniref:hypothetical protein n=1 Tax=Streptosporangium sp. NPDC051022 TaxID=3155752 RepID=UPI00341C7FD7